MITLADCQAFCDVDATWVEELASRESLTLIAAYAQAQTLHQVEAASQVVSEMTIAVELHVLPNPPESAPCVVVYPSRLAA